MQAEQKIAEIKQAMVEAMRTSDSDLYSEAYGVNGQILMEGGLMIEGREDIKHQIDSFMSLLGPIVAAYESKDIWDQGELLYESGRFSYTYANQAEEPFYTGTYVFIWRLDENGQPYIYRNISIDDE